MADRYAAKPVDDEAAYQVKLRTTQTYFRPDMKVLEFGCGTGSTALTHSPYVKHILATDIAEGMLGHARKKAKAQNISNVEFRLSTLEGLEAQDASFDAVLGLSILHLVEDLDSTIAEVYRVLTPGGFFASSTVCLGDKMGYMRYIAPVGRFLRLFPLLRVFSADALIASLEKAGFTIDHRWKSDDPKSHSTFLIARKPARLSA